jgi:hypothetical protein
LNFYLLIKIHSNNKSILMSVSEIEEIPNQENLLETTVIQDHIDANIPRPIEADIAWDAKRTIRFVVKQVQAIAISVIVDIALPLILYYTLQRYTSQLVALIVSGIPPLLYVIFLAIRKKRLDVLGCIIVFSFVVSGAVSIISGDARIVVLRESLTTLIIGLGFLITLLPIRYKTFEMRDMCFLITAQVFSELPHIVWTENEQVKSLPRMEWCYQYVPVFRKSLRSLTMTWAIILTLEFVAKVGMIESPMALNTLVYVNSIIVTSVSIIMSVGSALYSRKIKNLIEKEIAEWRRYHPAPSPITLQRI